MSEELELFVKCPECDGKGRREYNDRIDGFEIRCSSLCETCNGKGVVPWEPVAAPLVWEYTEFGTTVASLASNPKMFYICYDGYVLVVELRESLSGKCLWRKKGFSNEASAKAACQAHADGLVKQLLTENKQ